MPRYNWTTIRDEYVTGSDEVTLCDLARKHGPARETISRRSGREDWAGQRAAYRRQAAEKTARKTSTAEAEIRARHLTAAKAMMAKALVRLQGLNPNDLSAAELRQYIRDAAELERRAMGIADEIHIDVTGMTDDQLRTIVAGKSGG